MAWAIHSSYEVDDWMKVLAFAGLLTLMVLFGCLGTSDRTIPTSPVPNQTTTNQTGPATNQTNQTTIPPTPSNISTDNTEIARGNITIVPIPENQTYSNRTVANQTNANETVQNQTLPPTPEPAPQEPDGIFFAGGKYSLVLDDISVIPSSDNPCGIFSIRDTRPATEDPSDVTLGRMVICKGESRYWTDPAGNRYRILIIDVAAGYTQEAKWARAIIYG